MLPLFQFRIKVVDSVAERLISINSLMEKMHSNSLWSVSVSGNFHKSHPLFITMHVDVFCQKDIRRMEEMMNSEKKLVN